MTGNVFISVLLEFQMKPNIPRMFHLVFLYIQSLYLFVVSFQNQNFLKSIQFSFSSFLQLISGVLKMFGFCRS